MTNTTEEIQSDYKQRQQQVAKEIDSVLQKHKFVFRIQWNQNGPYLALLDTKKYDPAPESKEEQGV